VTHPRPHRLGPLELAVLDTLWTGGPATVDGVHGALAGRRRLARNTIQSTLERLVRKGLATRRKCGRAFEYRADLSRSDWAARALSELLDAIPRSDASLMVMTFVELTERAGEASLAQLEGLVRERRLARKQESR
jgi:predicted transcriptional regulator